MNFDPPFLIFSFIFSGIGFVYFQYGRKQSLVPLIAGGLALMVYPYFFDSLAWLIGVGVVLTGLPWLFR